MARLTSDFYVSSLMRLVAGEGGFASIIKKGAAEAGAVYIAVRDRFGGIQFYGPAPQQAYGQDRPIDRYFLKHEIVTNDEKVNEFLQAEARFDSDFWLIELEIDSSRSDLPFEIMTL